MLSTALGKRGKRRRPPTRLVVSYVDGHWSDRLVARRLHVETRGREIMLTIELAPRARSADAMRDLREKQLCIESLQLARPRLVEKLRDELRNTENVAVAVHLAGDGVAVEYPASITFGPDAATLTFG